MQPEYVPPAPPRATKLPVSRVSETIMVLFGTVIGILIFGGLLAWQAIFMITPPNAPPSPSDAVLAYRSSVLLLGWVTAILLDLAVGLSVTLAWVFGVTKNDLAPSTRTGMFVFAAVFLAFWILFSASFFSYIRSLAFGYYGYLL